MPVRSPDLQLIVDAKRPEPWLGALCVHDELEVLYAGLPSWGCQASMIA